MQSKRSLKQLLSQPQQVDIRQILTNQQIMSIIKNQDPVLKTIFDQSNTYVMLSYLNREHDGDGDGERKQLAYKLPYSAMEIMCCQSHHITEVIFESERKGEQLNGDRVRDEQNANDNASSDKKNCCEHLLEFLLSFLQYRQHYYLAGLFSKVVGSLTKRVFAPAHKYNQIICDKVFGVQNTLSTPIQHKPYLFQTLNHIYSQSINQLIIRWLTLKSLHSQYRRQKQQFISVVLELMNTQQSSTPKLDIMNFSDECLESIINLSSLMLKSPIYPPPPEKNQMVEHKNINLMVNKNAQKQLYQLLCQQKFMGLIFQPIPNPKLQKLILIKKILQQMRIQNERIEKLQQYKDIHLNNMISEEMMIECMEWIHENLLVLANMIQYKNSHGNGDGNDNGDGLGNDNGNGDGDDDEEDSFAFDVCQTGGNARQIGCKQVRIQSLLVIDKKYIIGYLQLYYQFHLHVNKLRESLIFIYEQKAREQVKMIIKFLRLRNNLIHNLLTKIVTSVLKRFQCPNFRTVLLHNGISNVIDEDGLREHVLQWAKIILESKNERGRIYENSEEEARWDHMAEVVSSAEEILIGRYRHRPSNLQVFFSLDKAKQFYSQFLHLPILIQYEQKGTLSKKVLSDKGEEEESSPIQFGLKKKLSSPPVFGDNSQSNGKNTEQKKTVSEGSVEGSVEIQHDIISQLSVEQERSINGESNPVEKQQIDREGEAKKQQDILGVESIKQGYLNYELDDVLKELQ